HSANKQIEASVAVDVDCIEDILTVGDDRTTVDVADRVAQCDGLWLGACPFVVPDADVAGQQLCEQVRLAVVVHVDESKPLAEIEILKTVRAPDPLVSDALEINELTRALLHEEIGLAVAVDVDELRPRHIEAAEERGGARVTGRVLHWDAGHPLRKRPRR